MNLTLRRINQWKEGMGSIENDEETRKKIVEARSVVIGQQEEWASELMYRKLCREEYYKLHHSE